MSRTSRLARRPSGDGGFTLIEVMAAMVIFAIAASAVTAMFATGLRASLMTKLDTNAKNLTQQRFETIRNLPFHIDQVSSGTNSPDLLDTYYVNASGSAARGATGYVPAGATRFTVDGDPATGAFYRVVIDTVPGFPKFKQYVATQFLDDAAGPVTPSSTFNALAYGADSPASSMVGVSVTTLWTVKNISKKQRAYTQIALGRPSAPRAVLQSQLTALRFSGGLSGGVLATSDLAALQADGSLSTSVRAAVAARAASLDLATGVNVSGALTSAQAPPDSGTLNGSAGPQSLMNGSYNVATVGSTSTGGVSAAASTGQPVIASSATPVRADVLGSGSGARVAQFGVDTTLPSRLGIGSSYQAYVADAACGGGCSNIGVSGYASGTSSGSTHGVSTSATGAVRGTVVLMPTSFAPNGLIRITLTSVSVSCSVNRTGAAAPTAAASVSYSGSLSYFAPLNPAAVGGYVTVALSSTQSTSPLTPSLLTSTQVATDVLGTPIYLSEYFASWGSMTSGTAASAVSLAAQGNKATASFSGVIGVTTVPLRSGDDTSAIGTQLGAGSCDAEDYR